MGPPLDFLGPADPNFNVDVKALLFAHHPLVLLENYI